MTKKHFISLANALKLIKPKKGSCAKVYHGQRTKWEQSVEAVAAVCKYHNHAFSLTRFKTWIGDAE